MMVHGSYKPPATLSIQHPPAGAHRGCRLMELTLPGIATLLCLGLVAGASGGLLGIGGSLVMIPGLVLLFGPQQQHLYQASAMIVNVFVVAPAVVRHWLARATLRPVTRWMIPSAVAGAIIGVIISEQPIFHGPGQGYLQITFAAFLGYVVIYNLVRLGRRGSTERMREADAITLSKPRIVGLVGLPTGMLGGILGIGGGLLAVPSQQVTLNIPLRNAIANSAATILWSSLFGAIVKNAAIHRHGFTLTDSVLIAACLIPTAMVGSWFAAGKVHQWPVRIIRLIFVAVLLYCGFRVFLAGWGQVN